MKIIIFGCGNIYREQKKAIPEDIEILCIIDNNKNLHGEKIDGLKVLSPLSVEGFNYDYIVLMSNYAFVMKEQLLQMGYDRKKIMHYLDFFGLFHHKIKKYESVSNITESSHKTLLIVSIALSFSGVPIAVVTTAKAALQLGYSVTIVASDGDDRYIKEAVDSGINIIIFEGLNSASLESVLWMMRYDIIMINALPMIRLAIKVAKKRKVIVWIHESPDEYKMINFWTDEINEGIQSEMMKIYAPSKRAKNHFLQWYSTKKEVSIFPLGIEDWKKKSACLKEGFIYGLIGGFAKIKGQDILLNVIENFPRKILTEVFFLLIGKRSVDEYGKEILNRASSINNCILLGERTQEEIYKLYSVLDVLVVASRAETVSMVAIEAMMMGKVCIVSDQTGIAEYIESGKNGFIFQSENEDELRKIMLWCYQHQDKLEQIGKNARETYEQKFSTEIFKNNLQEILQEL